jgi:2-polyprenyl-6-hydroxyphenyl methylase/3-demethylubiquinone-9 3-methyltransferase
MKFFTDVIDWVGGFPFEVAKPAAVADFLRLRGFELTWQRDVGHRHGCNEFVFRRNPKA